MPSKNLKNTRYNKILEEKKQLEFILRSLGEGFCILDKNGKIIEINKIVEKILKTEKSKIIGNKFLNLFSFYDKKEEVEHNFIINNLLENSRIKKKNYVIYTKDGKKIPVLLCGFPIKNQNKNNGCVLVFNDRSLEEEIDKIKTEFVSIASHQLRTPLASIKWTIELFLAENKGILNNRQKQLIARIKESNENMIGLVNDLLNVSRIEYGRITPRKTEFDLSEIITKVINEIVPSIKKKQQKLEINGLKEKRFINSDPTIISSIIQNLLSNASKYTSEKGNIKLKVYNDNNNILFELRDNGLGIPKNQHHRLFQKFFRADNVILKETEGTGLGLYLVKSFLNLINGEIWFDSKSDKGTTFYVKFPQNIKK